MSNMNIRSYWENYVYIPSQEELEELEFIDLVVDKRSLEEYIEENIKAHSEDVEEKEYLIGCFMKGFAYKREIYRRTGE